MTRREQIARVIAPTVWRYKDEGAYFNSGYWWGRMSLSLEAADRLIAAGLICETLPKPPEE